MNSEPIEPSHPSDRPSFFGLPDTIQLWAGMGPTFWGGVLFGLGLGLFVAKFLQELELWRFALVGFIAIVLVGSGFGIAMQAVRRSVHREKNRPQNK